MLLLFCRHKLWKICNFILFPLQLYKRNTSIKQNRYQNKANGQEGVSYLLWQLQAHFANKIVIVIIGTSFMSPTSPIYALGPSFFTKRFGLELMLSKTCIKLLSSLSHSSVLFLKNLCAVFCFFDLAFFVACFWIVAFVVQAFCFNEIVIKLFV